MRGSTTYIMCNNAFKYGKMVVQANSKIPVYFKYGKMVVRANSKMPVYSNGWLSILHKTYNVQHILNYFETGMIKVSMMGLVHASELHYKWRRWSLQQIIISYSRCKISNSMVLYSDVKWCSRAIEFNGHRTCTKKFLASDKHRLVTIISLQHNTRKLCLSFSSKLKQPFI